MKPRPRKTHLRFEPLERRQLLAAGPEVIVHAELQGGQSLTDVASNAAGQTVAVWYDEDNQSVLFQIYDAAGNPIGDNTEVAIVGPAESPQPRVAMDNDGDFVVVFVDSGEEADQIFAQRFDAQGAPVGETFMVNAVEAGQASRPDVAMDADGDFVVAWHVAKEQGVMVLARRFNAAGEPVTGDLPVSAAPTRETDRHDTAAAAVAMDADGDFVIAWREDRIRNTYEQQCYDYDGERYCQDIPVEKFLSRSVFARRYTPAGVPKGKIHVVSSSKSGVNDVADVDVAMDADGDFVVGWLRNRNILRRREECFEGECYTYTETIFKGSDLLTRRYTAAGKAKRIVKVAATNDQLFLSGIGVALDADGDLAAVWTQQPTDESDLPAAVRGRRYSSKGKAQPSFMVNANPAADVADPAVAMNALGSFFAAWEADDDIHARLFTV